MKRFLLASVAVVGLAGSPFAPTAFAAPADTPDMAQIQRMQEQHALMLDAHLAAMKAGLKLTDEQTKNWPAFETAIRNAEKARGSMAPSAGAYG
ncbi:MAG: Spy/CpxP family protein refolding chaperone [Roseiarcus sp.]